MINNNLNLQMGIIFLAVVGLTACSLTDNRVTDVDENLIIPPSLVLPDNLKETPVVSSPPQQVKEQKPESKAVIESNSNYYIIVGTYPSQVDAIGMFSRISSIGLKNAAMESRRIKTGNLLHMVRLGPYSEQEEIDRAKDSLTNAGLSGFKVVKN